MSSSCLLRLDLDLKDSIWRRLRPDGLVLQEDRYLRLGSLPAVDLDPRDGLDAAYLAIRKKRPLPLGRYLVLRPGLDRPGWVYQAVVHDLGIRPTCRGGDVRRALVAVVLNAKNRGINFLACEALGLLGEDGLTLTELIEAIDTAVLELCSELEGLVRVVFLLENVDDLEEVSNGLRSRILLRANRSLRNISGDTALVEFKHDSARLRFRFVPGSLSGYQVSRIDSSNLGREVVRFPSAHPSGTIPESRNPGLVEVTTRPGD